MKRKVLSRRRAKLIKSDPKVLASAVQKLLSYYLTTAEQKAWAQLKAVIMAAGGANENYE